MKASPIPFREKHPELPVLFVHVEEKVKAILKSEAKERKITMTKLTREILTNAAKQLKPSAFRR